MSDALLAALALVLIIEGAMPFAAPRLWRDAFRRIMELQDGQLRFIGLGAVASGLLMLYFVLP
jgi:uncharacterized protein YjeT (DUF2065 family)